MGGSSIYFTFAHPPQTWFCGKDGSHEGEGQEGSGGADCEHGTWFGQNVLPMLWRSRGYSAQMPLLGAGRPEGQCEVGHREVPGDVKISSLHDRCSLLPVQRERATRPPAGPECLLRGQCGRPIFGRGELMSGPFGTKLVELHV